MVEKEMKTTLILTPDEASHRIILDLCSGTGAWSKPYKDAGYDVRNITLPEDDVRTYKPPDNVYGILAAPPCTMFSFARTKAIKPRNLQSGMGTVIACLDIIWECQYKTKSDQQRYSPLNFWCLENPYYGMLKWFLGNPLFTFDPYDFNHDYQKKTALWGYFKLPQKQLPLISKKQKKIAQFNSQPLPKIDMVKSKNIHIQTRRSITPAGFAKAFYEANK